MEIEKLYRQYHCHCHCQMKMKVKLLGVHYFREVAEAVASSEDHRFAKEGFVIFSVAFAPSSFHCLGRV